MFEEGKYVCVVKPFYLQVTSYQEVLESTIWGTTRSNCGIVICLLRKRVAEIMQCCCNVESRSRIFSL